MYAYGGDYFLRSSYLLMVGGCLITVLVGISLFLIATIQWYVSTVSFSLIVSICSSLCGTRPVNGYYRLLLFLLVILNVGYLLTMTAAFVQHHDHRYRCHYLSLLIRFCILSTSICYCLLARSLYSNRFRFKSSSPSTHSFTYQHQQTCRTTNVCGSVILCVGMFYF